STDIRRAKLSWRLSMMSTHLLSVPLPFRRPGLKCEKCGHVWSEGDTMDTLPNELSQPGRAKRSSLFQRIVDYVLLAMGIIVLAFAIIALPVIGGKPGNESRELAWRIGAGVALALSLYIGARESDGAG